MQPLIVGLGGSLGTPSTSLAALRVAIDASAGAGARTAVIDLRALNLPMYVPGTPPPDAVRRMCDAVYESDGMIWSSPLYHGTISGAFKNALDWFQMLSERKPAYLTDKVVGLIATAGGTQGLQAVNTMEFIVRALRGWAVPLVIPIAQAWKVFDREGHTTDNAVCKQLKALGQEVARAAMHFAQHEMTTPAAEEAEQKQERGGS